MKILISARAEKELRKIAKIDQIAIVQKIRSLATFAPILQEEKLTGYRNIYRVRIGQYRIVHRRTSKDIYIVLLGHQKDIYHLGRQMVA